MHYLEWMKVLGLTFCQWEASLCIQTLMRVYEISIWWGEDLAAVWECFLLVRELQALTPDAYRQVQREISRGKQRRTGWEKERRGDRTSFYGGKAWDKDAEEAALADVAINRISNKQPCPQGKQGRPSRLGSQHRDIARAYHSTHAINTR